MALILFNVAPRWAPNFCDDAIFSREPRGGGRNVPIVRLTVEPAISADKKRENGKGTGAVSETRMEDVPRAYRGEKYRH